MFDQLFTIFLASFNYNQRNQRRQSGLKSGGRGSGSQSLIFPGKFSKKLGFFREFHTKIDVFQANFQKIQFLQANFRKILIFSGNFKNNFDWPFTVTPGQIILFLFKSHHF